MRWAILICFYHCHAHIHPGTGHQNSIMITKQLNQKQINILHLIFHRVTVVKVLFCSSGKKGLSRKFACCVFSPFICFDISSLFFSPFLFLFFSGSLRQQHQIRHVQVQDKPQPAEEWQSVHWAQRLQHRWGKWTQEGDCVAMSFCFRSAFSPLFFGVSFLRK